jgi:hypothetical protein
MAKGMNKRKETKKPKKEKAKPGVAAPTTKVQISSAKDKD